jgi:choline-phosphate cytidylyltransferase
MATPRIESPRGNNSVNEFGVEPFTSRFLSPEDLRNVGAFKDDIHDKSITTRVLQKSAEFLAKFIPATVAPNALTLMSLIAVLHAFHTTYLYRHEYPRFCTAVSIVMFTFYQILDLIDGKHARTIKNDSPLGYLFNNACDALAVNFIALNLCFLFGMDDFNAMWFVVQSSHLVFVWSKLSAMNRGYVSYGIFSGPGEAVLLINILLGIRAVFGLPWISETLEYFVVNICAPLLQKHPSTSTLLGNMNDIQNVTLVAFQSLYYALLSTVTIRCFFLPPDRKYTKFYLLFSLYYRTLPTLIFFYSDHVPSTTLLDVICDGLFMAIVTTDLTLARMAKRDLHAWVAIMAMASLIDKFFNLFMTAFYFSSVFYDVCVFLNLPMFTPVINVYIDGVFDLCHLGHKNHIARALKYGNRLLVGVMSDEDVCKYKREPVMTLDERCAEVEALRCVYKVIPAAPCFGLTKEFIEEHKIHIVLASPEYDKPDDKYYKMPRQMGIVKIMPRTDGVSTSELIERIRKRYRDDPLPPSSPQEKINGAPTTK